jgi:hypothetical protein
MVLADERVVIIMRGKPVHAPSVETQPCPPDNTTEHVMRQVRTWAGWQNTPVPVVPPFIIHPESAMEIAAWYAMPRNAFAVFASTGTITDDLAGEVQAEIDEVKGYQPTDVESRESHSALRALLAYVQACE